MYWHKTFDPILKLWWDNKWKKSNIHYNTKSTGYVNVRTCLYTSPTGYTHLRPIAQKLIGHNEDETMNNISFYTNNLIKYVSDNTQYGKNEFWQDAYNTLQNKKGDCDDYMILIKVLSLLADIPDYRVKCTCGDTYYENGTPAGGHAYILYLQRNNNKWIELEGSFLGEWKGKYGNIWFTFNREHSWSQHNKSFDRYKLKRLKEIAEAIS